MMLLGLFLHVAILVCVMAVNCIFDVLKMV